MSIFLEGSPPHCIQILSYLAGRPSVQEDASDDRVLKPLTAYGMADTLRLPISSTYTAIVFLEGAGLIETLPNCYRGRNKRARAYHLSAYGCRYAAALRAFQQTVKALR